MPPGPTRLRPGDQAPDIFLPAANGEEVSLRACVLEGPVLVEFIRGTWCPGGRKRLLDLTRERCSFRDRRTRVLVVVADDPRRVLRHLSAHPSPLTILIDEHRRAARAYGVHRRFSLGARDVARPASFLIDRAGFIRTVFVGRLPTEAVPVEEVLAAIDGLSRERSRFEAKGPPPEGGEEGS